MPNKTEKKAYNQKYYLQNKEKILAKAKNKDGSSTAENSNVFSLFQAKPEIPKPTGKPQIKKVGIPSFEMVFLGLLILAMSYFLISESQRFYFETEGSGSGAWLKALILEGCAIVFSIARAKSRMGTLAYKAILLLIYIYSLWVVSATVLQKAFHDQNIFATSQQSIQELESEISRIESISDHQWKLDRITLGKKYDTTLLTLREKLEQYRRQIGQVSDLKTVLSTLISLICFRFLVMVSNFGCLRLLKFQLDSSERT